MDSCQVPEGSWYSPADTWIRSAYSDRYLQYPQISSRLYPPGTCSLPDTRHSRMNSRPQASRSAWSTITDSRERFSRLPPKRSIRWLVRGDRNWWNSQPWPQCRHTPSNPASWQNLAALTKSAHSCSTSSSVMARMNTPSPLVSSMGPMGCSSPSISLLACPTWHSSTRASAPLSWMRWANWR